jgi:hypothetical protein
MNDPDPFLPIFKKLAADIDETKDFPARRLLLAHYTSIAALDGIVARQEVWFSHPLAMNDHEEMVFGMTEGANVFRAHIGLIGACETRERYELLRAAFEALLQAFWDHQAFDTYVFCAAEHEADDVNGRLSLWRGYGGNGSGAAIVLDTGKFGFVPDSPFLVGRMHYLSRAARIAWANERLNVLAQALKDTAVQDDQLHLPAMAFLERLKLAAIFSKDTGFSEELEWRVVYRPERDTRGLLKGMLSYAVGPRGIEPRLKLKIAPLPGLLAEDMSLEKLIDRIILGPSQTSALALPTVRRMLAQKGMPTLSDRVWASTTPFRPT